MVKARYVGVCRGCGAYTQPRNGKGDAYAYCKACHPGAIERRWTRARVTNAMRSWEARYGRLPRHTTGRGRTRVDWGRRARTPRRGRVAGGKRCHAPVRHLEGRPCGGRGAGWADHEGAGAGVLVIWQGIDLPAETPGIHRKIRGTQRR